MGETEPITLKSASHGEWTGAQDPELVDLRSLFESLIEKEFSEPIEPEFWRGALPPGYTYLRLLGHRTIHFRVAQGVVLDMVLRYVPPRSRKGFRRFAGPVQHSRAQRRYTWTQRLRALGINTPRPLGFIENAVEPSLIDSFIVTEYSHAPTLLEFRDEKLVGILRAQQNAAYEKNTYSL